LWRHLRYSTCRDGSPRCSEVVFLSRIRNHGDSVGTYACFSILSHS
jgi:hypothetical protein